MHRSILAVVIAATLCLAGLVRADVDPKVIRSLYERVTPSLVVVQFTYDRELGRTELSTCGVVTSKDGMVLISLAAVPPNLPDVQMKDFKIIIPGDDETEINAEFVARDERSALAFVKAKDPGDTKEARVWTPIQFEDVTTEIGDPVFSVSLLPKDAGYKSYIMSASVSAKLRGPVPQVMVSGDGLGTVGSPVFNLDGKAVGYVHYQGTTSPWFDGAPAGGRGGRGGGGGAAAAILNPPKFFVPAKDFMISFTDPPAAGTPQKLPQLGVAQMAGLTKDLAEYYNLKGQPAVQIGDVIPGFPAEKAGIKSQDIIVKVNGQPLERGDEPDEASAIMSRKIQRMKVGQQITLSILREKDKPLQEIAVTLEERPKQFSLAQRFYAEDLGFTTREMLFEDVYSRRLPNSTKGVVVAFIKQSSSAQSGKLENNDLIVKLNQTPVESLEKFKADYEAFRKAHPRDAVVMEVMRRGTNSEVVRIEPPQ